jgi:hypothetical protein
VAEGVGWGVGGGVFLKVLTKAVVVFVHCAATEGLDPMLYCADGGSSGLVGG